MDESSYSLCLKLLNKIEDQKHPLRYSISTIDVGNITQNIELYKQLCNKVVSLGLELKIIRTYVTDLSPEIPYLSICYLDQTTPLDSEAKVGSLALDAESGIVFVKTACRYLNTCKIS
mmetsp:Transcript_34424/g.34046  ORF Transcript_34424/g.34046 Transcript_34424/m.34046 type:complete len:118 (-) Transcript_34424:357-710(-)